MLDDGFVLCRAARCIAGQLAIPGRAGRGTHPVREDTAEHGEDDDVEHQLAMRKVGFFEDQNREQQRSEPAGPEPAEEKDSRRT